MAALSGRPESAPPAAPRQPHKPAVEIELKLVVPASALEAIRARLNTYGAQPPVPIESIYFDTADRRLALRQAALRVRRLGEGAGARWIQTLKIDDAPGALTRRGEWEGPVPGARPRLPSLADSPLESLLGSRSVKLVPVFRTRFTRTARPVQYQGARIELALDEGRITAGRRSEGICELELELLEGPPSAIFALALDLIGRGRQALALMPAIDSKAARGYRLAQRLGDRPTGADAEGFSALMRQHRTNQQVARRVVGLGVQRVLANVRGAATSDDLEYVHQARVALRRTRSALRLLAVATAADDPVARDLHWMADVFGAARDWDVLLTQTLPSIREAESIDETQWARLIERAQRRRQLQRQRLRTALAGARFAITTLRLLQWADAPVAPTPAHPKHRARRAIQRGHERLTEEAQDLSGLSPKGRHRLRILAKRQRYALELLAPALPAGASARTLKLLSRLQQLLGEINDAHVAVALLPSLTRSREIVRQAQKWSEGILRRNLPRAQARLERLRRRGSGL
jgi:triphosphatase